MLVSPAGSNTFVVTLKVPAADVVQVSVTGRTVFAGTATPVAVATVMLLAKAFTVTVSAEDPLLSTLTVIVTLVPTETGPCGSIFTESMVTE